MLAVSDASLYYTVVPISAIALAAGDLPKWVYGAIALFVGAILLYVITK